MLHYDRIIKIQSLESSEFTPALQRLGNLDLIGLSRCSEADAFTGAQLAQLATVLADRLERTGAIVAIFEQCVLDASGIRRANRSAASVAFGDGCGGGT